MQIERAEWRPTLAGCKVIIHQHLDQTLTLMIAGHRVGQYSAEGKLLTPLTKKQIRAVEKTFPARQFHEGNCTGSRSLIGTSESQHS
jgi:hypothetical protein